MPERRILTAAAVLLGASLVLGSLASAAPNNTSSTGKTQNQLEDDGYKCEVVSVGFNECKKGTSIYWCSAGSCQPKPRIMPGTNGARAPVASPSQKLTR